MLIPHSMPNRAIVINGIRRRPGTHDLQRAPAEASEI